MGVVERRPLRENRTRCVWAPRLIDIPGFSVTASSSDSLSAALARHDIELPPEQVSRLEQYCRSLWSWNEKLNLTRHTDYEKFVSRDVADSLALEAFLDAGERVLDVGTGGGVPGIVLAIVRPDLDVSLCDSVAKKAKAVEAIVAETGLVLPVYHAAAQQVLSERQFDTLVARAVAPLTKLLRWVAPHWESFNRMLVIKGPAWVEERSEARAAGLLRQVELRKLSEYPLPGGESQSVVLSLRPREI
jgi:16S rRNA (guanine527-N7)-methyltransferase